MQENETHSILYMDILYKCCHKKRDNQLYPCNIHVEKIDPLNETESTSLYYSCEDHGTEWVEHLIQKKGWLSIKSELLNVE